MAYLVNMAPRLVELHRVRHDHEWLKYMSELAGDDELRAKMGEAAR